MIPAIEVDVIIAYTNHRGEAADRRIRPLRIWWGSTGWHPEPQWLLDAHDLDKGQQRTFAVKDISRWRPAGEGDHVDHA